MAANDPPIRVRNTHHFDFVDKFANHTYVIKAGEDTIIPFDAMILWLGNPKAVDVDGKRRYRRDEFRRLRVRYGAYDDADLWEQNKPQLSCTTIDGQPITTIVDDPDGKHLTPAVQSQNEREALIQRLDYMQRAMTEMQQELNRVQQRSPSDEGEGGIAGNDQPPAPHAGAVGSHLPPIDTGGQPAHVSVEPTDEPPADTPATPDGPSSVRISS